MQGDGGEQRDHLGQRRLTGRETAFWYGLAFVTYVGLSLWHKFLLNWIVGPAWLIAFAWLGPAAWDRVRPRKRTA